MAPPPDPAVDAPDVTDAAAQSKATVSQYPRPAQSGLAGPFNKAVQERRVSGIRGMLLPVEMAW